MPAAVPEALRTRVAPVTSAPGRRPALDGLRALAVTAVAVYHFGGGDESWLPGGYLGVDVFFVLSGYLITGLLLSEHARTHRISLIGFWSRRVRRLAPALIVMLLVVAGYVWWATSPTDYPGRRADIFWTLGYLANWHLAAGSETYFAAYGTASPLRHTWSLAVEEQFYFVWPAVVMGVLWLGARLSRAGSGRPGRLLLAAVAGVLTLASAVAMAQLYDPLSPSIAYYSTRGRVQELLAGALLALLLTRLRGSHAVPVAGLAWCGLAGLAAALVLLPDTAALYYRGGALLVGLVTVLVIAGVESRPDGTMARAFSWRPAVLLGRISYGVYLWHWPVLVAIPATGPPGEQALWQLLRVLVTLGVAVLSYRLVELPVQHSRKVLGTPPRVLTALVASAALVVGVTVPATALPAGLAQQISVSSDRACPGERLDALPFCVWPAGPEAGTPAAASAPTLAVLGDSTARALAPGLDDWATARGTGWIEAAWKRCTATGLLVRAGATVDLPARTCQQQARAQISRMLDIYRPKTVLISEFWIHHQPILLDDGTELRPGTPEHDAAVRTGLLGVVDEVAARGGRTVLMELPPPGQQVGLQVAPDRPAGTAKAPVGGAQFVPGFNVVLRSVVAARPDDASTVSVTDLICPDSRCPAISGDRLIRVDGVHYSVPFSRELVPTLLSRAGVTA